MCGPRTRQNSKKTDQPICEEYSKQKRNDRQSSNINSELESKIDVLRKEMNDVYRQIGIPIIDRNSEKRNYSDSKPLKFLRQADRNDNRGRTPKKIVIINEKWSNPFTRHYQKNVLRKTIRKFQERRAKRKGRNQRKWKNVKQIIVNTITETLSNNNGLPGWLFELRKRPTGTSLQVYPAHGSRAQGSLDSCFQSMQNGDLTSQDGGMNFEWMRIKSFASFSCTTDLSPITLARIGFYHTGRPQEVKCYSCGATYSDWCPQDDPLLVHRRIAPECRHLAGTDDTNVAVGHREASGRSGSFSSVQVNYSNGSTQHTHQTPRSQNNSQSLNGQNGSGPSQHPRSNVAESTLSTQASTQTLQRDIVRNNTEQNQVRRSAVNNGQLSVQGASNQNNSTALSSTQYTTQSQQQRSHNGISDAAINKLSPLGVNFDKPRYPQYAVLTTRMNTYSGWSATQPPRTMAEAGFIYAGYADYTRCFFCGGGLRNWEEGDDPWIEHARWFPRCAYIRQNKGDQFVQLVHERLQEMLMNERSVENESKNYQSNLQQSGQLKPEANANGSESQSTDLKSLPSYLSVLELGYESEMIENVIKHLIRLGKSDISSSDILQILFKIEEGDQSVVSQLDASRESVVSQSEASTGLLLNKEETSSANVGQMETEEILEENRRLKELTLCMICVDNSSCITFLPCGHLVCCEECAPAMRKCPKCHRIVQGSIKTWLV